MGDNTEMRLASAVRKRLTERLEELERRKIPVLETQLAVTGDPDVAALLAETKRERDRMAEALSGGEESWEGWDPRHIEVGDSVTIREVGSSKAERYTLAPPEAGSGLDDGWISASSPVGSSLIGHAPGEIVEVHTPGGVRHYRIIHFEQG